MLGNLKAKLDALARQTPPAGGHAAPPADTAAPADTATPCAQGAAATARDCRMTARLLPLSPEDAARCAAVTGEALWTLNRGQGTWDAYDPARTVFLDTETTGLSGGAGTVAFLIGLGTWEEGGFRVEQYFMQDYDVEPDMLGRLCQRLAGYDTLVTYNGKSYDSPLLQSRSILNRLRPPLDRMAHLDLLHAARRLYKRRLPACGLRAMEEAVLDLHRVGDIPGGEIPDIFFSYLKDGDDSRLRQVMDHNRQDILSMALLLGRLCEGLNHPLDLPHAQDRLSYGLLLGETGQAAAAEACLRSALELPEACLALAQRYKRAGRYAEALSLWEDLMARGLGGVAPYIEAAKYYEHAGKSPGQALSIVRALEARLRRYGLAPDPAVQADLDRRLARLTRRCTRERNQTSCQ